MDDMNQPPQPAQPSQPFRPAPAAGGLSPSENLVKQLCATVASSATWMKLLGVLLIIYGIFLIISVVGILICWLPIWLGVILFRAAGDAEVAHAGTPTQLLGYVRRINRFFLIEGILALIGLVIGLIFAFVFGMAALWGSMGLMH
jgi:hypothetical protein